MVSTTSTEQELFELLARIEKLILQKECDFQQEEKGFGELLVKIAQTVVTALKPILKYVDGPFPKKYQLPDREHPLRGVRLGGETSEYFLLRSGAVCQIKPFYTGNKDEYRYEYEEVLLTSIPEYVLLDFLPDMFNALNAAIKKMNERQETMQARRVHLARILSEFQTV